jgi:hypothetical protein
MLPGGPYDLWRADEDSHRVKDLASAFAENPRLPKMLRQKEILDTIDNGVRSGVFVAVRKRPDQSISGTWWRTPIEEGARNDPALEVFLPEKATLAELHSGILAPGVLPSLWTGEAITVAEVAAYFAGGRTVMVQRDGYDEPVLIPASPQAAVETAIGEAVRQGVLWLVNGPASFQGEPVPAGVLTASAQLRAPMPPLTVHQLTQDGIPEAWRDDQTNVLALSVALSAQSGHPLPWSVMRRAIADAIASRWLELAPGSSAWPCEMAGAAAVTLKRPASVAEPQPPGGYVPRQQGVFRASAAVEPSAFQDLVEVLPDLIKLAAGIPLQFRLCVTLGDGQEVGNETIVAVNKLLGEVSADLRLTT